jgi:hypothetical protein
MKYLPLVMCALSLHAQAPAPGANPFLARCDGKEYPVYVLRTLGGFVSTGTKPARTVAFTRKDPNTLEWTDRLDGKTTATGVNQVSEDGKTMTETTRSFDALGKQTSSSVIVFDKQ